MGKLLLKEDQLIQMTANHIRSFYNRSSDITAPLAEDFMWIGANHLEWCTNADAFISSAKKEYTENPVLISNEEYHLLFHDRNIWIIYGRYTATAALANQSILQANARVTYVWRKKNDKIQLAHIHGSNACDLFLQQNGSALEDANAGIFDYLKQLDTVRFDENKLIVRDTEGKYRYVLPADIVYIQAAKQYSVIHTQTDAFQVRGVLGEYEKKLAKSLRRIHKSYLINKLYIDSIRRYQVTLKNGQIFPIGKDRYMDFKRYLQEV